MPIRYLLVSHLNEDGESLVGVNCGIGQITAIFPRHWLALEIVIDIMAEVEAHLHPSLILILPNYLFFAFVLAS